MATEVYIKMTAGFADSSTRKIELGPYKNTTASAVQNAKTRIKAIDPEPIKNLYLSDDGAAFTGIVAADVEKTTKTEIDLTAEG